MDDVKGYKVLGCSKVYFNYIDKKEKDFLIFGYKELF